jgi:hypothetical protein
MRVIWGRSGTVNVHARAASIIFFHWFHQNSERSFDLIRIYQIDRVDYKGAFTIKARINKK